MSTAVLPFFKVTKATTYIAKCRHCPTRFEFSYLGTTRDSRMLVLARHLADSHQMGPLA